MLHVHRVLSNAEYKPVHIAISTEDPLLLHRHPYFAAVAFTFGILIAVVL